MSNHPRTDIETGAGNGKGGRCYVSVNFACRIEKELNEALEMVIRLQESLRPLVAMWKKHEQIVKSGKGIGQEDAYYCFYKGKHNHWENAVESLRMEVSDDTKLSIYEAEAKYGALQLPNDDGGKP